MAKFIPVFLIPLAALLVLRCGTSSNPAGPSTGGGPAPVLNLTEVETGTLVNLNETARTFDLFLVTTQMSDSCQGTTQIRYATTQPETLRGQSYDLRNDSLIIYISFTTPPGTYRDTIRFRGQGNQGIQGTWTRTAADTNVTSGDTVIESEGSTLVVTGMSIKSTSVTSTSVNGHSDCLTFWRAEIESAFAAYDSVKISTQGRSVLVSCGGKTFLTYDFSDCNFPVVKDSAQAVESNCNNSVVDLAGETAAGCSAGRAVNCGTQERGFGTWGDVVVPWNCN